MDSYDLWAISTEGREVLIFAVAQGDPRGADSHISAIRELAGRTAEPLGHVYGNWRRTRRVLADRNLRLEAALVDLEVPAGRTITRVTTLASAGDASGLVPDELVEAAAADTPTRPATRRSRSGSNTGSRATTSGGAPKTRSSSGRPAASRPAPSRPSRRTTADEDELVPCQKCFMLRRPDQLEDGVCKDGCL